MRLDLNQHNGNLWKSKILFRMCDISKKQEACRPDSSAIYN